MARLIPQRYMYSTEPKPKPIAGRSRSVRPLSFWTGSRYVLQSRDSCRDYTRWFALHVVLGAPWGGGVDRNSPCTCSWSCGFIRCRYIAPAVGWLVLAFAYLGGASRCVRVSLGGGVRMHGCRVYVIPAHPSPTNKVRDLLLHLRLRSLQPPVPSHYIYTSSPPSYIWRYQSRAEREREQRERRYNRAVADLSLHQSILCFSPLPKDTNKSLIPPPIKILQWLQTQ